MELVQTTLIAAAHAAEADSHGGSALADPKTWVFIGLLTFFVAVWRLGGFKMLLSALDARAVRIAEELKEAERLRADAAALLADYQAKKLAAESEARAIVAQARADAETLRAAARRELDADIARRERITEERIARAEEQALQEVRGAAVSAAIATAERLLSERIDARTQDQMVEAGLGELGRRFG